MMMERIGESGIDRAPRCEMLATKAMSASSPHISVIVVCKNPGIRLHATLESVWSQQGVSAELVVVDGASTDGTVPWLESRRDRMTTLISEPDQGVYDAMNKGVSAARGQWLFFLGGDDRLATSSVLAEVAALLSQTPNAVVSGEARFDDGRLYPFAGSAAAIRRNFVHHQATFYRRELFTRHGHFDTSLRIQADYDHNLRLLHAGEIFVALPLRIAECSSGGLSDSGRWANYREEITARHRHFPAWRCWLWDAFSIVRFLRKNILSFRRHA